MKELEKFHNLIILENSLIKDALLSINDNQRGGVIIVDNNLRLIGVISDGDIRRVLIKGLIMESPIKDATNLNPIFLEEKNNNPKKQKKIFENHTEINILPIIDKNNKIIDIIIRNPNTRK